MTKILTISLQDNSNNVFVADVELWLVNSLNGTSSVDLQSQTKTQDRWLGLTFTRIGQFVNCSKIPLYLLLDLPLDVFSSSSSTEEYFRQHIVQASLVHGSNVGVLFLHLDTYLTFYFDPETLQIKCLTIDFNILNRIDSKNGGTLLQENNVVTPSSMAVFDKVLSRKRKLQNQFIMPSKTTPPPTQLSSQTLTTNEQITLAISKLVLSGLRLRGLSGYVNTSVSASNEKLAVREIYHMTQKSALFAVRKFGYGFNNQQTSERKPVQLNDVQDIVEKLLLVYIDMDDK